jgi:hypothetical protein
MRPSFSGRSHKVSEFVHISEVLPGVMRDIEQRMDAHQREQRAKEQAVRQTHIKDAVRDFFAQGLPQLRQARVRRDDLQGTLFNSTTQRTAQP